VPVQVRWRSKHRDDRFRVTTEGDSLYYMWWNAGTEARHGVVTYLGQATWGSSASWHGVSQVYDAASRMWTYSLSQSNRMQAYFGAGFKPNGSGATSYVRVHYPASSCPSGAAWGWLNKICIPSDGALMPQMRTLHELGHVAEYVSNRNQSRCATGYNYNMNGDDAWDFDEPEYHSTQFVEAVATHLGTVSLYYPNANAPRSCLSWGECTNGGDLENIVDRWGNSVACSDDLSHWPRTAERYFWDTYDSNDGHVHHVWELIDTIHAFDNGFGNRRKNEAFGWLCIRDDNNGHSTGDFVWNWRQWGVNTESVLNWNCAPAHDD